jgi:signal transduction histidine kinase
LIDVEFDASERAAGTPASRDLELEPDATGHLLGLANEALSNVARHSGATRAAVAVATADDGGLTLRITDNGRGFDPSAVQSGFGHHGLANMRSRADSIGATMEIDSGANGTTIEIRLPGPGPAPAGAP